MSEEKKNIELNESFSPDSDRLEKNFNAVPRTNEDVRDLLANYEPIKTSNQNSASSSDQQQNTEKE